MMMDKIKKIEDCLISHLEREMDIHPFSELNTYEMGEVVDMIKDLAEACYYCSMMEHHKDKDD